MTSKVLIQNFSESLKGAKFAQANIISGPGHLVINRFTDNEQLMAKGTLQYLEKQGVPSQYMEVNDGQAVFTLKAGDIKQPRFQFPPWAACGGAYEWQIQLNPDIGLDINVQSRGGNVKLNLAGMTVRRLVAESGGGNLNVVLPDNSTNLISSAKTGGGNISIEVGSGINGVNTITAESGAGNVLVRLPDGVAVKIHAHTGMGKTIVDPRFTKIDKDTYQSFDYTSAPIKLEVTARTGAGNVSINTR